MQTVRPRSSSFVLLLLVATSCLLSGANRVSGQQQAIQACIDQWRSNSSDCCPLLEELIEPCLNAARDGLVACLKNLQPSPNLNCWNVFLTFLTTNCSGSDAPCDTPLGRKACGEAGRALYRWCRGLDPDVSTVEVTPEWVEHPVTVQVGNAYQLVVTTNDAAVQQVRFWAIRLDAPATAADTEFELGSAAATPLGGNRVAWSLTTDTGDWPLEAGEQRVFIVARSEAFTSATATKILDISTLIEVEIE